MRLTDRALRAAALAACLLATVNLLTGCTGTDDASHAEPLDIPALEARVAAQLETLREKFAFPGATAAFVLPDGRSGQVAIGVEDPRADVCLAPEARMPAGSIGKIFVSGVVVSLVQDGVISLDDPLSKWASEKSWYPKLAHADDITLRMLLTHSAGVPNHIPDQRFADLMQSYIGTEDFPTPEGIGETIVQCESTGEPGAAFAYTDAGFVLAGIAMEVATGESYWDLLNKRVLEPFELELTSPAIERTMPDVAQGFVGPGGMFGLPEWSIEDGSFVVNPGIEYTGGGVVSHATDLARFARDLWSGRAYGEDSLAILYDQAFPLDNAEPQGAAYGIGVFIDETPFGRRYHHRGTYPGYKSITGYLPEHDLAIAVQINSSEPTEAITSVFEPLARILTEALAEE